MQFSPFPVVAGTETPCMWRLLHIRW